MKRTVRNVDLYKKFSWCAPTSLIAILVMSAGCGAPAEDPAFNNEPTPSTVAKPQDTGEAPPIEPVSSTPDDKVIDLGALLHASDVRALSAVFSYTATNTNNALQNTVNWTFHFYAGQTVSLGTCGVSGASGWGDTYLRLYNGDGLPTARNDDACGSDGLRSKIVYRVPVTGTYRLRAGCYSDTTCGGTVAVSISQ